MSMEPVITTYHTGSQAGAADNTPLPDILPSGVAGIVTAKGDNRKTIVAIIIIAIVAVAVWWFVFKKKRIK